MGCIIRQDSGRLRLAGGMQNCAVLSVSQANPFALPSSFDGSNRTYHPDSKHPFNPPADMSLSKMKMPKMRPITDEDLDGDDVVAYTSTNDSQITSFTALSAPNSRHAARLARIAMAVQNNQPKKHGGGKAALPPASSRHRAQIQGASEPRDHAVRSPGSGR